MLATPQLNKAAYKHVAFSAVGFDELELHEDISQGSLDFHEWTSLVSEIEKKYHVSSMPMFQNLVVLFNYWFLNLFWKSSLTIDLASPSNLETWFLEHCLYAWLELCGWREIGKLLTEMTLWCIHGIKFDFLTTLFPFSGTLCLCLSFLFLILSWFVKFCPISANVSWGVEFFCTSFALEHCSSKVLLYVFMIYQEKFVQIYLDDFAQVATFWLVVYFTPIDSVTT